MAAYYQTKAVALVFLLLFIGLSFGQVLDVAEDTNIDANLPSEAIGQMKRMRKVVEIVALLDYDKDGHPNPKHEPPKNGKSGNP